MAPGQVAASHGRLRCERTNVRSPFGKGWDEDWLVLVESRPCLPMQPLTTPSSILQNTDRQEAHLKNMADEFLNIVLANSRCFGCNIDDDGWLACVERSALEMQRAFHRLWLSRTARRSSAEKILALPSQSTIPQYPNSSRTK